MATTNSITGKEISSSAYSKQGRINHDRIFAKKSAMEWLHEEGPIVYATAGFFCDGDDMETPISYQVFQNRLNQNPVIR